MKKLLFLIMTLGVIMTACKKDEDVKVSLDGNQWITEELEAIGDLPAGMFLMDFGAKSGPGKMKTIYVVTEGNSEYNEGDLILMYEGSYTYDASTGKITVGKEESMVEYVTNKKIRITEAGETLILSLVEGKQYNVKDAIDFNASSEEFEITPSKDADWAGGAITFTSNRTIKSLTYDVLTEGLTEQQELCKTTLADNTLTLGQYVGAGSALANCRIQITAADEDGNETTCIVTSKAWRPAVYTENQGVYTEDRLTNGWSRGQECWLGALCADGEIPYDGTTGTFGGVAYTVPSFMTTPFGTKDNKVGYDTPSTNNGGTITYTYGDLSFELTIDIDR